MDRVSVFKLIGLYAASRGYVVLTRGEFKLCLIGEFAALPLTISAAEADSSLVRTTIGRSVSCASRVVR